MKKLSMLITAITVMFGGLAFVAPAANADTTIKIESVSFAETSASAKVDAEVRATINGATQVNWEVSNHNVKITMAQVRKAPHIKVNATGANSSKVIYKKTNGANVVVLKKGSCVRNTGRLNRLRVGFVWCPKNDAVLVLDKKSGQYRHAYNIIGGKLVKTCLNYIGGNVPMEDKVVQVQFAGDIVEEITLSADVSVSAKVKASLECSTGTLEGEASASASAKASAKIRVKVRVKITAINAAKVALLAQVRGDAKVSAEASAKAKITLTCSDTPPPATPAPRATAPTINDVLVNNERTMTFEGKLAKGTTGIASANAGSGTILGARQVNLVTDEDGYFTVTFTYRAGDEPGTDAVQLVIDQSDGQSVTVSTNRFEVRAAPVDPM